VARDSILWEKAYAAYLEEKKLYRRIGKAKPKVKKHGMSRKQLYKHNREIERKYRKIGPKPPRPRKPLFLYALRLAGGHYYVGISTNVSRRFHYHKIGKGSLWTMEHKAVQIVETRLTGTCDESKAAGMEDKMTLEYAARYGKDKVRGGGYCQRKPRWPEF